MNESESAEVPAVARVLCPRCGSPMNFHAEKIDFGSVPVASAAFADESLGGVLAEFHTCPGCRYVLERPGR